MTHELKTQLIESYFTALENSIEKLDEEFRNKIWSLNFFNYGKEDLYFKRFKEFEDSINKKYNGIEIICENEQSSIYLASHRIKKNIGKGIKYTVLHAGDPRAVLWNKMCCDDSMSVWL